MIDNPAIDTLDRVWLSTVPPPQGKAASRAALDAWCEGQVRQAVKEFLTEGLFWLDGRNVEFTPAEPMSGINDGKLARPPRAVRPLSDLLAEVIESNSVGSGDEPNPRVSARGETGEATIHWTGLPRRDAGASRRNGRMPGHARRGPSWPSARSAAGI
jgi:hypothetical protein